MDIRQACKMSIFCSIYACVLTPLIPNIVQVPYKNNRKKRRNKKNLLSKKKTK